MAFFTQYSLKRDHYLTDKITASIVVFSLHSRPKTYPFYSIRRRLTESVQGQKFDY